jgi:hypothetical protein
MMKPKTRPTFEASMGQGTSIKKIVAMVFLIGLVTKSLSIIYNVHYTQSASMIIVADEPRQRADGSYQQDQSQNPEQTLFVQEDAATATAHADIKKPSNYSYYDGETFSACLIFMDDNARLSEWIAYHYHVMPLRYLVFFRDPKGALDPKPILDRWHSLINITYWTDESSFMSNEKLKEMTTIKPGYSHYIHIQREFYRSCFRHLKENNRTWTLVVDTDEFLGIKTQILSNDSVKAKPGIVMDVLKASHQENQTLIDFGKVARGKGRLEEIKRKWGENCIGMARLEITSFESKREEVLKHVPSFLDGYRFVTMRFRHLGASIIGKSIIDVSKYDVNESTRMNAHHLIGECNKGHKFGGGGDIMYVNHYLASWELYDRPNDKRQSKFGDNYRFQKFMSVNNKYNTSYTKSKNFGKGDEIRPWLPAFVDYFGQQKSSVLLEGVGFSYNESTAIQPP